MKVLIVSKFFYSRGGADLVAMTTRELLRGAGHEVQVFAMDYPDNIKLPEQSTWPAEIDFNGSLTKKISAFVRLMGLGDVASRFRKVLKDFRPDVVHCHNIHSYLSPVVVTLSHQSGARTVWTIHDLKLVCPAYLGRRPDGTLCTDCVDGRSNLMKYNCLKGSRLASFMALLESIRWNRGKLDSATDCFIAPSEFMKSMLVRGGFSESKIRVLHNCISPDKLRPMLSEPRQEPAEPYFTYIGRLSAEKGVKTLVLAAKRAGVRVLIGGDGPMRTELEELARGSKIEFLGNLDAKRVGRLLRDAAASVMPSECFENNPLSVIESLCAGTPVIGAKIGGIPELIEPGVSGEHFPSGSVNTLAAKLATFNAEAYDREAISRRAINEFSEQTHLENLLKIYQHA